MAVKNKSKKKVTRRKGDVTKVGPDRANNASGVAQGSNARGSDAGSHHASGAAQTNPFSVLADTDCSSDDADCSSDEEDSYSCSQDSADETAKSEGVVRHVGELKPIADSGREQCSPIGVITFWQNPALKRYLDGTGQAYDELRKDYRASQPNQQNEIVGPTFDVSRLLESTDQQADHGLQTTGCLLLQMDASQLSLEQYLNHTRQGQALLTLINYDSKPAKTDPLFELMLERWRLLQENLTPFHPFHLAEELADHQKSKDTKLEQLKQELPKQWAKPPLNLPSLSGTNLNTILKKNTEDTCYLIDQYDQFPPYLVLLANLVLDPQTKAHLIKKADQLAWAELRYDTEYNHTPMTALFEPEFTIWLREKDGSYVDVKIANPHFLYLKEQVGKRQETIEVWLDHHKNGKPGEGIDMISFDIDQLERTSQFYAASLLAFVIGDCYIPGGNQHCRLIENVINRSDLTQLVSDGFGGAHHPQDPHDVPVSQYVPAQEPEKIGVRFEPMTRHLMYMSLISIALREGHAKALTRLLADPTVQNQLQDSRLAYNPYRAIYDEHDDGMPDGFPKGPLVERKVYTRFCEFDHNNQSIPRLETNGIMFAELVVRWLAGKSFQKQQLDAKIAQEEVTSCPELQSGGVQDLVTHIEFLRRGSRELASDIKFLRGGLLEMLKLGLKPIDPRDLNNYVGLAMSIVPRSDLILNELAGHINKNRGISPLLYTPKVCGSSVIEVVAADSFKQFVASLNVTEQQFFSGSTPLIKALQGKFLATREGEERISEIISLEGIALRELVAADISAARTWQLDNEKMSTLAKWQRENHLWRAQGNKGEAPGRPFVYKQKVRLCGHTIEIFYKPNIGQIGNIFVKGFSGTGTYQNIEVEISKMIHGNEQRGATAAAFLLALAQGQPKKDAIAILKNAKMKSYSKFLAKLYVLFVWKETSRRYATGVTRAGLPKQFPFATAILAALDMISKGELKFSQVIGPDCLYGLPTGQQVTHPRNEKIMIKNKDGTLKPMRALARTRMKVEIIFSDWISNGFSRSLRELWKVLRVPGLTLRKSTYPFLRKYASEDQRCSATTHQITMELNRSQPANDLIRQHRQSGRKEGTGSRERGTITLADFLRPPSR